MMHIRLGTKILLLAIKSILLYILDSEVKLAWAAFLPQNNPSNIRKFAHIHVMRNDQWQQNSNSSSNQNNQHNLLITSNGNNTSKDHYYNLSNLHIKSNNSHPYSILLENLRSCTLSSTTDLLSMDDIIRLLTYLKKIKTRIKTSSSSHISSILSSLQTNLEISFQHVMVLNGESSRSSNMHISQLGRHYQYLSLLYFLRLYTSLIKSCNLPNTTTINTNSDNQNSLSQAHSICPWEDESSLFYFDKMAHIYRHSLKSLFHDHQCINQWSGIQRTSVHHGPNTLSPFQENDSLIANFLASSIPDLTNINSKPPLINTFSSAIISPPPQALIVTEELKNRPNPPLHFEHTTSTTFINNNANDEWTFNTDTQLYPVPLTTPYTTINSDSSNWNPKPANYYDYSTATSNNSPMRYPSNGHPPSEVLINYPTTKPTYPYWQTPTNNYPTYPPSKPSWHPNPYPPIDTGQLQLNFPPLEATTSPALPSPPVFIEPIVVSSPDQLPPNYHLPQGDTVLGHNPVSVVVGNGPPEIVILHDIVFSQPSDVGGVEVEGTTIGNYSESMTTIMQENEEEQDINTTTEMWITTEENSNNTLSDSQSGGGSSSAAGNSAAAAAVLAAGVGAGAAGLLGGAAAGAIAAGATGAAAIAANAAGDGDDDGTGAGGDIVDAAAASLDDAIAYSPAVTSDSDFEAMANEMEDLLADLFSYGVVRTIGMAIYSMVLPHISFLLTSGLTIISFFFPWLYPHIIEPSVDFMVNLV